MSSDFSVLRYASSGMDAQRGALDVLAHNVALAQTAGPGHAVHPLVPELAVSGEEDPIDAFTASIPSEPTDDGDDDGGTPSMMQGVLANDPLPGEVRFAGAHPSPNAVSGIDAVSEMVGVLNAQRSYEANASVFDIGKQLIERTIDVEQSA